MTSERAVEPEPYATKDVDYWRKQVAERKVHPEVPWRDTDVILVVARFLATLDAATPEPREDGWEELRREIEALHDDPIRFGSAKDASQNTARAVLAAVDRLAAARGEPGLREALDTFFEDIDADWTNDNIRPGDFAFRFRHAADTLRAALATPTTPEPDPQETRANWPSRVDFRRMSPGQVNSFFESVGVSWRVAATPEPDQ